MKLKLIVTLLLAVLLASLPVEAAKIDKYRENVRNNGFTLKYELSVLPVRRTNKEAAIVQEGWNPEQIVEVGGKRLNHSGIIVVSGDDKYVETVYSDAENSTKKVGTCTLFKNGERFNFYYDIDTNGKKKYYGGYSLFGRSRSVKAIEDEPFTEYLNMFGECNFVNPLMMRALVVILPPEKIITTPDIPHYKFIGSGSLSDGLTYEDFASSENNKFFALRYYFDGDRIVKIALASYTVLSNIVTDYQKFVINVSEFMTNADNNYLVLPSELKDKTKRKEIKGDKK